MKKRLFIALLVNFYFVGQLFAQLFGGHLKPSDAAYPPGTVHCNPKARTAVVEVTSPGTGRAWMDRNLGAERAAISSTDDLAFGDLYQWGRGADGHQCRNSGTRSTLSSSDKPGHGDFILVPGTSTTDDWRNPQSNSLWQGVNGINNPCPIGFRIPTEPEFRQERLTWTSNTSAGAFNSVLKLPLAGFREQTGVISLVAEGSPYGFIWSSTVGSGATSNRAEAFAYYPDRAYENPYTRARGYSVRCIKN